MLWSEKKWYQYLLERIKSVEAYWDKLSQAANKRVTKLIIDENVMLK